jgi:branched-chain amino acid aminotransferase
MNVLWETGPANVQTVQAHIKGRELAYTTVQTMLNVLHRKGKVKRQLKDRAYRYRPVLSRQSAVTQAVGDALRENGLAEGYIRPLAFIGDGVMGLNPADNPVRVAVIAWAWGKYLGEEGMELGIRCRVSSFTRHHVNAKMAKGKTCGDYVNSILAKREALLDGYDEAILLDTTGLVAEASGENLFVVRDGEIKTPPLANVLEGITRSSVIELARDKGMSVSEVPITRDELYVADEVFLTGTAAEVTPVREIDHRQVGTGRRGPITKALQDAFFDVVAGRDRKYERWLSYV